MATSNLSVYLNVNGAEEAEAKLKRFGKYGDVALKGISASAQPVNQSLITLNQTVGTVSRTMQTFTGIAGAYLGFQGISGTIGSIKETNIEFQKLSASLKVIEKDAIKADDVLNRLDLLAAQTPYSVQALTDAWIKLGALGLKPSEEALVSYGNTASAMGKDLMQFIEAVADAPAMEFERLKEFGIKASQQGDEVSFTFQGVTTTVKKNADEIVKYLHNIGDTTFAGAMAEQMNTIDGSISNLEDNIARIQRRVGESGFNAALKDFYSSLGNVVAESEDSAKALGSILGAVTNGATLLVNNLDVLGDAAIAFAGFKTIQAGSKILNAAIDKNALAIQNMALGMQSGSAAATRAFTLQAASMTTSGRIMTATMSTVSLAARGLSASLALVGGPVGLVAIAGFSIYEFAKKSDVAAESSSKYAEELKEVEKNSKSLKQATDDLTSSQTKQTKLTLLSNIDDVKADIEGLKDQLMNTNYSGVGFWGSILWSDSAALEEEIIKLKTQMNEGELSIDEFVNKMRSLGESNIDFRQPAMKAVEISNTLKAAELALDGYQDKLNALDNSEPLKTKTLKVETKETENEVDNIALKTKAETLEGLIAKSEKAQSSVGKFEASLGASLDSNSWIYGALEGFDNVSKKAGTFASSTQRLVENAFNGMTDCLVEFAKSGKLSFSDLTNSIITDMIRMQIQQSITAPLSQAFSSVLSGYFSGGTGAEASTSAATTSASVLHVGGMPGATAMSRSVPESTFINAPRFHTGRNLPWLRQNEIPAILKDDEMVLSGNTVRKLSQSKGSAASPNINVTIHNNGNSQVRAETSEDTNGFNLDIIVEEIEGTIANNVSRNRGPLNDVLQQQFKSNGANY